MKDLLFIHGWAFSSKVFEGLPGLKVDLPAHGASTENYRDLDSLLWSIARRIPDQSHVVGWSLGGSLALLLALRFPRKVKNLLLIGTTPFFGGAWHRRNIRAFKAKVKREGVDFFRKIAYGGNFRDRFAEKEGLRLLDDYINLDLRSLLPSVKKKVLIVHGTADEVVPPTEALKLHTLIKDSKLIFLPGGHYPFGNEKGLFLEVLKVCRNL